MLNAVVLGVIMLNVVVLGVIMLNVVAFYGVIRLSALKSPDRQTLLP